jgi:hypothetical protein
MQAHFKHLHSKIFFNDIKNFLIQWVLTHAITLWKFESPLGLQLPKLELTWKCGSVGVYSLTLSHTHKA